MYGPYENNDPPLVFTPALAAQQAQQYKFIVQTYYGMPKAQQFGITTWNCVLKKHTQRTK